MMKGAIVTLPLVMLTCCLPLAAGEVEMTLDTMPTGARVELGGGYIGVTPLRLNYPTAYFQTPMTIWARHLSAPLRFTFTSHGYATKTVDLGDGPNSWTSLNGRNRFDYYLLHRQYVIELEAASSTAATEVLVAATALEKLAQLRDQGILTAEEFEVKKRLVLGQDSSVEPPSLNLAITGSTDPTTFCRHLLPTPSSLHKLDLSSSPIVPTANGPIVRCLWMKPDVGVASATFYVQCGISDRQSACAALAPPATYSEDAPVTCQGSDGSRATAILRNGCVALASASGEPATSHALLLMLLATFSTGTGASPAPSTTSPPEPPPFSPPPTR
jgi:Short C-terminal domain